MTSFLIAFALIAFSIALWVFVVAGRGLQFKKLVVSGVETRAIVAVKTTVRMGKGRRPALTYELTDPTGKVQRHRAFVTQAVYDLAQEGAPVAVMYLPEMPSVNALKSDVEDARSALAKRSP